MKHIKVVSIAMTLVAGVVIALAALMHDPLTTQASNTHSIDLEGSSAQFLSISDASQTGLDITGDLTIESWVKLESQPGEWPDARTIVSKHSNNSGYELMYWYSSGTYHLELVAANGSTTYEPEATSTSAILPTGAWAHVAAVYTSGASPKAEFYVDGLLIETDITGLPASLGANSADFNVGRRPTAVVGYFDGKLDDVRIWNIARSGTEIADDQSRELNGNETGLVAYWKLNNNLSDTSSSGNTLSNNNSAVHDADTPFGSFTELLAVRKSQDQSVANSTTLTNDSQLKLSLAANKTYAISGILFAKSVSGTPDIKIAFYGQTGVDLALGYTNDTNEMVLSSGQLSNRIDLQANTPQSIFINGTITTGSTSGDFQLKWAQNTSNASATVLLKGSYLKAIEL